MSHAVKKFLALPLWRDYRVLLGIWILLAVVATLCKVAHHGNNFLIYKFVFWHVLEQKDLYQYYPDEFGDLNHYGPFFSLIIAPFAIGPKIVGMMLWNICLTLLAWVAIRTSRFSKYEILFMLWFSMHDLLTCLFMQQFNIAVGTLILLAFTMTERKKDFWAAFFICAGVFVKLLPIVGVAFFFFSQRKKVFVASLLFWSIIMFCAPMLISSPEYIIGQYESWFHALQAKNATNIATLDTRNNISLVGMVQRIAIAASGTSSQLPTMSSLILYLEPLTILFGVVVVAAGYFRVRQWGNIAFRKMVLVQMLLFVVLFSTGTENSSYFIAYVGLAVWYASVPWKRSNWDMALLAFAFLFGSLCPTDIYPAWLRHNVILPYALRALPVAMIWAKLSYEMIVRDYSLPPLKKPEPLTSNP